MTLIDQSTAALIRLYQRWISPYKGFRCAYGVLHGSDSCSQFALQAVEQRGWDGLWEAFPQRLAACRTAAGLLRMRSASSMNREQRREQSGENPVVDGVSHVADGCLDVGCDVATIGEGGDVADCCSIDAF